MTGAIGLRIAAILLAFALLLVAGGAVALAQPTGLSQAKAQADALRKQIQSTNDRLQQVVDDYNLADTKLAEVENAIAANKKKLSQAQAALSTASDQLAARLAEMYKRRDAATWLEMLFSSNSLADLTDHLVLLGRIGKEDARLVADVTSDAKQVTAQAAKLQKQYKDQLAAGSKADKAKRAIEQRLAENKRLLQGKDAAVAALEQQDQAQQAASAAAAGGGGGSFDQLSKYDHGDNGAVEVVYHDAQESSDDEGPDKHVLDPHLDH